ncbi:MAG: hypothetical protein ACREBU_05990 [Nitrososphaera sp.]
MMKRRKRDEQVEEAARRYHELTLRPELEPMVSPEGIFREVAGRLPNAAEASSIKKRIAELKSIRSKDRKKG